MSGKFELNFSMYETNKSYLKSLNVLMKYTKLWCYYIRFKNAVSILRQAVLCLGKSKQQWKWHQDLFFENFFETRTGMTMPRVVAVVEPLYISHCW